MNGPREEDRAGCEVGGVIDGLEGEGASEQIAKAGDERAANRQLTVGRTGKRDCKCHRVSIQKAV
jgi:hypothetical protein